MSGLLGHSGRTGTLGQIGSGEVIYIENRAPVARASDQTEDIKLIIEF